MEAIQLELFDEKPQLITKMKNLNGWIIVDNHDRDVEKSIKLKHHYPLVIDLKGKKMYDSTCVQSRILPCDKKAEKIDILHYLQVSNLLRVKKMIYNKKKFQLENIK